MLKKLQNLLFEDDDVDEEEVDDEEETEEVVEKPKKRRKPAPVKEEKRPEPEDDEAEEVVRREPEKKIQRIDVTQPITQVKPQPAARSQEESVFRRPAAVQHASPRPVEPEPQVQEEKAKPSLGITVDELSGDSGVQEEVVRPARTAQPSARPSAKPAAKKQKPAAPSYEFQPVISPIFGVDEKDLSAVQTTATKAAVSEKEDENVSKIISPIYGVAKDAAPSTIQKTVERSNEAEDLSNDRSREVNEDDVPDFSLDDILKVRDEEYAAEAKQDTGPLFPDLDMPEEEDDRPVDNTTVIKPETAGKATARPVRKTSK